MSKKKFPKISNKIDIVFSLFIFVKKMGFSISFQLIYYVVTFKQILLY